MRISDWSSDVCSSDLKKPPDDRAGKLVEGVMATVEGIMLSSANDMETIHRALPVFDALYALFSVEHASDRRGDEGPPAGVSKSMWLTAFISAVVVGTREQGRGFDGRTPLEIGRAHV